MTSKLQKSQLDWWYAIVGIVIFFAVGVGIMIITGTLTTDEQEAKKVAAMFGPVQSILMFIISLVAIRLLRGKRYQNEDAGLVRPTTTEILYAVGVAIIFSVITWVAAWLSPELSSAGKTVASSQGVGVAVWRDVLFVLTAAVCAPLGEEIIFRGLIFRGIYDAAAKKSTGRRAVIAFIIAALVAGVLFAITHIGEGQEKQAIYMVIFSVMAAWLYWKTKSLYAPILAHSINNMIWAISVIAGSTNPVHPAVYVLALATPFIAMGVMLALQQVMMPLKSR